MNPQLMTRILLATDFSDCSGRAQEYAMYFATAWDAKVDVLHVVEGPPWLKGHAAELAAVEQARTEAAQRLDVIQHQMARSGIGASMRQVIGIPSEHINFAAREGGADLVVLGTQGRTNLLYGLVGSTAERVIKVIEQAAKLAA